nr:flavoprotein YqcA [Raoultella sp. NCTC 9187]
MFEDPEVQDWEPYSGKYVLVVTSTTGQGDLPDSIIPLYEGIKDMYQPHLRYGIIALGDSTYANFCGGGKTFDAAAQEQGAKRRRRHADDRRQRRPGAPKACPTRGLNSGRPCSNKRMKSDALPLRRGRPF